MVEIKCPYILESDGVVRYGKPPDYNCSAHNLPPFYYECEYYKTTRETETKEFWWKIFDFFKSNIFP